MPGMVALATPQEAASDGLDAGLRKDVFEHGAQVGFGSFCAHAQALDGAALSKGRECNRRRTMAARVFVPPPSIPRTTTH